MNIIIDINAMKNNFSKIFVGIKMSIIFVPLLKNLKRSNMLKMNFNHTNTQDTWGCGVLRAFLP